MSLDRADGSERYGWRRPRPLGYGLFPQRRPLEAGLFAALTGPMIGVLAMVVVSLFTTPRALRGPEWANILVILIWVIPLAYLLFATPALFAGMLYGAWWRRAPNRIAAVVAAPFIGAAASGAFAALLGQLDLGIGDAIGVFSALGAAGGLGCALWLDYLWHHRAPDQPPRQQRGRIAAMLAAIGMVAAIGAAGLPLFEGP